ncbi:MAG: hypothetical protein U1E76_25865 [Planctomycetota bacterium]
MLAGQVKHEAAGLLSIEEPFATLTLFDQGRPAQLRSIGCDLKSPAALTELGAEIKRSALFFKQHAQGRTLGCLYVSGLDQDRAELLAQSLHEQLDVPCEPLPIQVPFHDEENLPAELPCLQAMLYEQRDPGWLLDLTPAERRARSPLATVVMAAVIVLALAVIATGRMVLSRTLAQTEKHHRALASEIETARTRSTAALRLRALLGDAVALQQELNAVAASDVGLAALLTSVLKDLPSTVALSEISLEQGPERGQELAGGAAESAGEDDRAARRASFSSQAEMPRDGGRQQRVDLVLRGRVLGEAWDAERALSRLRAALGRLGKAEVETLPDEVEDGGVTASDRGLLGRPFRLVARIEVKR